MYVCRDSIKLTETYISTSESVNSILTYNLVSFLVDVLMEESAIASNQASRPKEQPRPTDSMAGICSALDIYIVAFISIVASDKGTVASWRVHPAALLATNVRNVALAVPWPGL